MASLEQNQKLYRMVRNLGIELDLEFPQGTLPGICKIQYSRDVIAARGKTEVWKHNNHKRRLKQRKLILFEELLSKRRGDKYGMSRGQQEDGKETQEKAEDRHRGRS